MMLYLADSGNITITPAILATIIGVTIAAVFIVIKILTKALPAVDRFFGTKEHQQRAENAAQYAHVAHAFLEASEKRPLVLHTLTRDVPAEMVLRMSTAEKEIVELQQSQLRQEQRQNDHYEKIMGGIGEIREAMAAQGFRMDHPRGQRRET